MNKLLYLSDDEIQSQLAAKYDLLVYIGHGSLQYAIIDSQKKETKALAEFEASASSSTTELIRSIENLAKTKRELRYTFNRVKISLSTSNYTFIPSSLYDEAYKEQYGKYIGLTDEKEILINTLFSDEFKNVTHVDSNMKSALQTIFHNPTVYSEACPFLESAQIDLQRDSDSVIFIDMQPGSFQICLFKELRLEFYNTFEYLNADEFNYYLLNAIQSLEISLNDTEIILSGKVSKNDETYQRLEKYFENIRFANHAYSNDLNQKFDNFPAHTFSSLFSLDLCE